MTYTAIWKRKSATQYSVPKAIPRADSTVFNADIDELLVLADTVFNISEKEIEKIWRLGASITDRATSVRRTLCRHMRDWVVGIQKTYAYLDDNWAKIDLAYLEKIATMCGVSQRLRPRMIPTFGAVYAAEELEPYRVWVQRIAKRLHDWFYLEYSI